MESLKALLSASAEVLVPEAGAALHDVISRWSDSGVSLPAVVVTPNSEEDVVATVKFAASKKLRVIPANGGHGSYVPINENTVYLDMKRLNGVSLNKASNYVTIAGGATSRDVLNACTAEGFYTTFPNSNAVGMIGALLGGGSGICNGIDSFGVDNILSIRLVTASGAVLDLSPSSKGEESALFSALCGAGHGLGIVTSLALKAFPISNLRMTEDKIWVQKMIFPATAVDAAATLFESLLPPPPAMVPVFAMIRAPPISPMKGQPLVMVSISYYGPQEEAEKAVAAVLTNDLTEKAVSRDTVLVPFEKVNDASEPSNAHGGFKKYHSCSLKTLSAGSIISAFHRWEKLGEDVPEAKARSYVLIISWNTTALMQNATVSRGDRGQNYYTGRDRPVFVQAVPWSTTPESKPETDKFGTEIVSILRKADNQEGTIPRAFVNNIHVGSDMNEVYTQDMIAEIKRIKNIWDEENLFWSPVANGWS